MPDLQPALPASCLCCLALFSPSLGCRQSVAAGALKGWYLTCSMPVLQVKGLDTDALQITHIQVNQAQKQRRRTYRAHGRINRECLQQHPAVQAAAALAPESSLRLHTASAASVFPVQTAAALRWLLAQVLRCAACMLSWCVLVMGGHHASGAQGQHGCMVSMSPLHCLCQDRTTLHSCSASRPSLT